MPNKILQRVQRLLEKGQRQGFPIPIWTDWSEIKQKKTKKKFLKINMNYKRTNKTFT